MNTAAILKVADALEHGINNFTFQMHKILEIADEENNQFCGCFIGATILTLIPDEAEKIAKVGYAARRAATLLGLSLIEGTSARALFYPAGGGGIYTITAEEGSRVLRHLASTGKVDYSIVRETFDEEEQNQ